MDSKVLTTQVVKPTNVVLTMTWDEANLLYDFFAKIDLNVINRAMGWGTHSIHDMNDSKLRCTCGKNWPCSDNSMYAETAEAVFQIYSTMDTSLRKWDHEH